MTSSFAFWFCFVAVGCCNFFTLKHSFGQKVTVTSSAADLPIGTEVTLNAATDGIEDPKLTWRAKCVASVETLERQGRSDPCANGPQVKQWRGAMITDLSPIPGKIKYRAIDISSTSGETSVTFHEPDQADPTIGEPFIVVMGSEDFSGEPIYMPEQGSELQLGQKMETRLKWDNQDLGACAHLCFKEKVTYRALINDAFLARQVGKFKQADWFPASCQNPVFGNPNDITQMTMYWDSPVLKDLNWNNWSYRTLRYINKIKNLPEGTELALRQHQYMFYGETCSDFQWGPLNRTIWFKLVVECAKDAAGQKIVLPDTSPVRYFRIPVLM